MEAQNGNQGNQDGNRKDRRERQTYTNYSIFKGLVQLIQPDGKLIVIDRDEAIEMAKERGEDLIQVAYNKNANPHCICKIANYGKMKYEQKKRDKEAAKRSRVANAEAKEVVFTIRIDDGDFEHKIGQVTDFLAENLKVKLSIKLNRREQATSKHLARDMMKRILARFDGKALMDGTPSDTGRFISCQIRPAVKPAPRNPNGISITCR